MEGAGLYLFNGGGVRYAGATLTNFKKSDLFCSGLIGTILATASVAILMEGAKVFGSVLEEWSPHVVYNQGSSLNTASPPPRPPPLLSLISRSDNTSVRR